MSMRYRQLLVAFALALLAVWATVTWMGASPPEPTDQPSPTGAIGSGPATFEPSDGEPSSTPP